MSAEQQEPRAAAERLKRLKIRAWRRGMKEMDLILGDFVDAHGASLGAAELDRLELLMERNDQELYLWLARPDLHAPADATSDEVAIVDRIRASLEESGVDEN